MLERVSFNWTGLFHKFWYLGYPNGKWITIPQGSVKWNIVPLYPACQTLDIIDLLNCTSTPCTPANIIFDINQLSNLGISIFVEEKNKVKSRTVRQNALSYIGPLLQNRNLNNTEYIKAIIKINQNIDLEEDANKQCKNYPDDKFESYDDCDKDYIRNKILNDYNYTTFWSTDDLSEVSRPRFSDNKEEFYLYNELFNIFNGMDVSPCSVPCLSSKVTL